MAQGTFAARVYTSRGELPLQGVSVSVYSKGGDLLALRLTDESGLTEPFALEAPDSQASRTPEADGAAFAVYDLRLELVGYYTEWIRDIQVFGGVESVSEFPLVPLEEFAPEDTLVRVYTVIPQNL